MAEFYQHRAEFHVGQQQQQHAQQEHGGQHHVQQAQTTQRSTSSILDLNKTSGGVSSTPAGVSAASGMAYPSHQQQGHPHSAAAQLLAAAGQSINKHRLPTDPLPPNAAVSVAFPTSASATIKTEDGGGGGSSAAGSHPYPASAATAFHLGMAVYDSLIPRHYDAAAAAGQSSAGLNSLQQQYNNKPPGSAEAGSSAGHPTGGGRGSKKMTKLGRPRKYKHWYVGAGEGGGDGSSGGAHEQVPGSSEAAQDAANNSGGSGILGLVSVPCEFCGLVLSGADSLGLHLKAKICYSGKVTSLRCTFPNCTYQTNSKDRGMGDSIEDSPSGGSPSTTNASNWVNILVDHVKARHTKEADFPCTHCGRKHYSEKALRYHMKQHENKSKFFCDQCQHFYPAKLAPQHPPNEPHKPGSQYAHLSPERSTCQVCGKVLSSKGALDIHMRTHSKEFEFECDQCPRKFHQKNNLYIHMERKHQVTIPKAKYDCPVCGKKFHSPVSFRTHVKKHSKAMEKSSGGSNSGGGMTPGGIASAAITMGQLYETAAAATGGLLSCTICRQQFPKQNEWERHMLLYHSGLPAHQ